MRSEREKTNVKVKVLDMDSLKAKALKYIKEESSVEDKEFIAGVFSGEGKLGYITTSKGIFVLCEEGVGNNKPITKDNPYKIEFRADYLRDGVKSFSMVPIMGFSLDDKDVLGLPVLYEEGLDTFIRKFGSRLEDNYESWKEAMEKVDRKRVLA